MGLFEDILDGTIAAGATSRTSNPLYDTAQILSYPENFVTDSNNNRLQFVVSLMIIQSLKHLHTPRTLLLSPS
ncbi:MAG: hypothetical protein CM15mV3_0520 [Caudoviricetes sp.]|nr:MAG: hypothetical protein CM15mV3_0520 [Caudoviricetes sp.]